MKTTISLDLLVKEHPFLRGLPQHLCDILTDCAQLRRFASRQRVFQEGGDADHFYLIVSGAVTLETCVPKDGMVPIQQLGAGDALGWSWLFPPYLWHFSAVTTAPTEVIFFDALALREKAAQDPQFRSELLTRISRTLLQRLQATRRQLVELHCSLLANSKGEPTNEREQKAIPVPSESVHSSHHSTLSCARFVLTNPEAEAVFVAGSFKDWNPGASPLNDLGHSHWVLELSLPPGR